MSEALCRRAKQFLRTARLAHRDDMDAAYENARLAAELAGKALLAHAGAANDRDHNVAPALVKNALIPAGPLAKDLSRFLQDYNRGRYGVNEPVGVADVEQAFRLAEWMVGLCQSYPPQP